MKVPVTFIDSKLRKHCFEVDKSSTAEQLKALLQAQSLVPDGYCTRLCYRMRQLEDSDSLTSIDFAPSTHITFVTVPSPRSDSTPTPTSPCSPLSSTPAAATSVPQSSFGSANPPLLSPAPPTSTPLHSSLPNTPLPNTKSLVSPAPTPSPPPSVQPPPPRVQTSVPQPTVASGIHSMGFDPKQVARALKLTRGNEENAINIILEHTLDGLPEELDEEIVHEGCSANSNGRPVSLPREVRESLKSAVMESGIPKMHGDVDGRVFDMALDEFCRAHPDAAAEMSRRHEFTDKGALRAAAKEAVRQSGIGIGRREPKVYEIGGDDDPDVIAQRQAAAAASPGSGPAVAYD